MKVRTIPLADCYGLLGRPVKDFIGYPWGCACGESYKTKEAAEGCKRCKLYLSIDPQFVYYTPELEAV